MLGKTNSVLVVSGGGGGDSSGDIVQAVNNLGLETVLSGTKVMLNHDVSVIGDLEANLHKPSYDYFCFGNNYLFCGNIYRINSDLTLTKLTHTDITSAVCGTITKYKHFYRWDTGYEFVVFDAVKNLLYTSRKEKRSWQNSQYYAGNGSSVGYFYLGKFDDNGQATDILSYTISNASNITYPIFYWNNILWIYATNKSSNPTFYAYNINEVEKTATLLTSFAAPYSIGNNTYNYIFQVSDNSFLRTINGVLFKFTAQENGTLLQSYVDDKGYALDIQNKAEDYNKNNQVYNPDNQTFTIIKDKILHILKYNADNNSLDEISTVDLSSVYTKIAGKYPSYAKSILNSAITSNNNYLNLSYNSRSTSGGYKTSIVSLKNSLSDWKADTNSIINMGANTLTGYTTGNVVDDKLEISTILPPKINVQLTTPANNAQITINGSEI